MGKHKTMVIKFLVDLSDSEYQKVRNTIDSVTNQWVVERYE